MTLPKAHHFSRAIALIVGLGFLAGACDGGPDPEDSAVADSATAMDSSRRDTARGETGTADTNMVDTGADDTASDTGLSSDAMVGDDCEFNRDCAPDQRCVGDDDAGTRTCQLGARGSLQTGEACSGDEMCASGVCFADNATLACTAPCETVSSASAECGGLFPACREIPFLGRLCATAE